MLVLNKSKLFDDRKIIKLLIFKYDFDHNLTATLCPLKGVEIQIGVNPPIRGG